MRTVITQIPSVNLIPNGIHFLLLDGRKWMPSKSRDFHIFIHEYSSLSKQSSDPTYDIGSLVEYQMEGTYKVEALYFNFYSEGENIIDMACRSVGNSFYADAMIYGWSSGFEIPEWVHNKSNGSSVKIDLVDNVKLWMGCAIFIVCDYHQFHSPEATSISLLFNDVFFRRLHVWFTFWFETDEGYGENFIYNHMFPSLMSLSLSQLDSGCIYRLHDF